METNDVFYGDWNLYMYFGIVASIAAGIAIFLFYEFKVLRISDYKEKYDYVNQHEIRYFWYAVLALIIAAAFAINTVASQAILETGERWFFVRIFISLCFLVIGYFIFFSLIKIYYPTKLSKRLEKLRTTPRLSPDGNIMRKLTEDEEDMHMEKSMIQEEDFQVVDYDVWIDDKTGYKKIEKYIIQEQATECPECGYYTLIISSEEIGKAPTETEGGIIYEHLECSYCEHKAKREVAIARLSTNVA